METKQHLERNPLPLRGCLALLVILTPIFFLPQQYDSYKIAKELLFQLLTLLLAFFLFLENRTKKLYVLQWNPLSGAVALFILITMLSLLSAESKYEGAQEALSLLTGSLLFFLIAHRRIPLLSIDRLAHLSLLSALPISLLGIYLFTAGEVSWLYQSVPPASTFGHRNFAATYLMALIPLNLYLFFKEDNFKKEGLYALFLAILNAYFYCTYCRSAWGGLGVGFFSLFGFLFLNRFFRWSTPLLKSSLWTKRKLALFTTSLLLSFFLAQLPQAPQEFEKALFEIAGGTGESRMIFWKNTLAMVKDHPLGGVGVGNFKIQYPQYWWAVEKDVEANENVLLTHPHNDYLEILAETGVPGLLSFLLVLLFFLYYAFENLKNADSRKNALATLFLTMGAIAVMARAFFGFPFRMPLSSLYFWLYLALAAQHYNSVLWQKTRPRHIIPSSKGNNLCLILSLLSLLMVFAWSAAKIKSQYHLYWAITYTNGKLSHLAKMEALRAVQSNPWEFRGHSIIAGMATTLGEYEEAEKYTLRALHLRPYTPYVLDMLGYIYLAQGKTEASLAPLRQAISLKPDYLSPLNRLGIALVRLGKYQEARKTFLRLLSIDPNHGEGQKNFSDLKRLLTKP